MYFSDMNEICRLTKLFCENTGRTLPLDKDVEMALRHLNVSENAMIAEITNLVQRPNYFVPHGKTLLLF